MTPIISADEIKKTLPGYDPNRVERFHRKSARIADREFDKQLKSKLFADVILMSGGTAAGKTEFLVSHLDHQKSLILDTTLPTIEGAKIKIKKIIKYRQKPIVYTVIPDDLQRSFIAFLNRERKFDESHFYRTHVGSRKTLLWIVKNYPQVKINIIISSYVNDKLRFAKIKLKNNQELIEYLENLQLQKADIINAIQEKLSG